MKTSRLNPGLPIGLLTTVLLTAGAAASTDKPPRLKDVFKHHFYVGVAINHSIATDQASPFGRSQDQVNKDVALTVEQFNQISPENDLKWSSIQPRPGPDGYNFGPADAYVDFGLKHHMLIVGHNLVWQGQTPFWVFAAGTPQAPTDGAPAPANPPANPPAPANAPGQAPSGARVTSPPTNAPRSAPGGGPFGRGGFNRGRFGGGFRFTGPLATRDELLKRMRDHIMTVVGRYKGKIKVWDVVNEPVADGGPAILKNTLWERIIGPDYVARAFEYAHKADPKAILRINDYGLENPAKRQRFITLVKQLQAEHVPVMAVGSETHISVSYPTPEEEDQALTDLEQLRLPIHITELDVNGAQSGQGQAGAEITDNSATTKGGLVSDADQRLATQYANLFKVFMKHKSVKVVTFWDLNDATSWRSAGKPLLFDGNDNPKPAFYAVVKVGMGK
ncbi:MAG TPA: endo-1,4-beta-xylanase [Armatimonadota bacterium]|nr:endo-1,4-beta-xylanase [Armatimonadota bacterium]